MVSSGLQITFVDSDSDVLNQCDDNGLDATVAGLPTLSSILVEEEDKKTGKLAALVGGWRTEGTREMRWSRHLPTW